MTTPLRLDGFLPYRLSVASNRASDAVATAYRALFGLTIAEWRLIAVLAEGAATTQQALGRATRMDKVTVSRAAIALANRGLVARGTDTADSRAAHLSLTAAGQTLYEQVAPKALEIEAALFAGFSDAERAQFADLLRRVEAAADAFPRS